MMITSLSFYLSHYPIVTSTETIVGVGIIKSRKMTDHNREIPKLESLVDSFLIGSKMETIRSKL